MAEYIDKAKLVGKVLTSSEQQLRFRGMTGTEAYNEFLRLVNEMPAADVAPVRHGEWVLKHIGHGHYWECSECHTNPCIYVTKDTKFCPNCGARMDLGGADNGE